MNDCITHVNKHTPQISSHWNFSEMISGKENSLTNYFLSGRTKMLSHGVNKNCESLNLWFLSHWSINLALSEKYFWEKFSTWASLCLIKKYISHWTFFLTWKRCWSRRRWKNNQWDSWIFYLYFQLVLPIKNSWLCFNLALRCRESFSSLIQTYFLCIQA